MFQTGKDSFIKEGYSCALFNMQNGKGKTTPIKCSTTWESVFSSSGCLSTVDCEQFSLIQENIVISHLSEHKICVFCFTCLLEGPPGFTLIELWDKKTPQEILSEMFQSDSITLLIMSDPSMHFLHTTNSVQPCRD